LKDVEGFLKEETTPEIPRSKEEPILKSGSLRKAIKLSEKKVA
jgi:hypothetical protein